MSFARLFADELAFLQEVGRDFAGANPNLAPLLADEGGDPDVRRLFEGFAFLTAKLRQRMDEDLPELLQDLVAVLAPQLLAPVPPMTTVEWLPRPRALSASQIIPRGTRLRSRPAAGTACRFVTSFDVALAPLRVAGVTVDEGPRGATVRLAFETTEPMPVGRLGLSRLRLHLAGGGRSGLGPELLRRLLTDAQSVRLSAGSMSREIGSPALRAGGLDAEDAVLPLGATANQSFRLIQEYLVFPQKFLYLDVSGLEGLAGSEAQGFEISIRLDHSLDDLPRLEPANFRLHCTPAVNWFEAESEPLTVDGSRGEYRLRPQGFPPGHAVIARVQAMWGWLQGSGARIAFEPFTSFGHLTAPAGTRQPVFRPRLAPATVGDGTETLVSFGFERPEDALRGCVASARMLCTNGELPGVLPAGGLDVPDAETPPFASFRNIDPITGQIEPPLAAGLLAPVVAVLAGAAAPITDLETLRRTIAAFEFRLGTDSAAERALRLRLAAIREVRSSPLDWFVAGRPVRGQLITFDIAEREIGGLGEAWLLGAVLNGFLAARAPINTCFQAELRCLAAERSFRWPVHDGTATSL